MILPNKNPFVYVLYYFMTRIVNSAGQRNNKWHYQISKIWLKLFHPSKQRLFISTFANENLGVNFIVWLDTFQVFCDVWDVQEVMWPAMFGSTSTQSGGKARQRAHPFAPFISYYEQQAPHFGAKLAMRLRQPLHDGGKWRGFHGANKSATLTTYGRY